MRKHAATTQLSDDFLRSEADLVSDLSPRRASYHEGFLAELPSYARLLITNSAPTHFKLCCAAEQRP